MQAIEHGKDSADGFMSDIEDYVRKIVSEYNMAVESSVFGDGKPSREPIGKCPKCGADIFKGKYGYYCSGKCGMQLAKVYGKELTESQLKKLLSGSSITVTSNSRTTTVLPEFEPYSYKGKSGYQWKTKSKK